MTSEQIISLLPYNKPFLFVDEITSIDENGVTGHFFFDQNLDFYKGHFKAQPVTPGVILTETMAQIGVVSLGIYLLDKELNNNAAIALTSASIDFLLTVYPGEKVTVVSTKKYFRFGKLKCDVTMTNRNGETVCSGTISGMIISKK
ncbi:MAG TPA: 3-hydroxyacyl-ACP dehydratase FabZ family protein [Flavobacterium sp.]|nr:3-hydroxyacyl-ACP dehydratase FabZ family protein [Flavobacterium sp.]